ncbi:TPA: hypothetical protein ACH3X2_009886 [Trebouxia sp. C0005]
MLTANVQLDKSAAEQKPLPIPDQAQEEDAEAELTFACQQLAEAAANHAKQKAALEQALFAHTADPLSAQIGPPDAALSAPHSDKAQSTDCSAISADSVNADMPTHYQPDAAPETAAPNATAAGATASTCTAPGAAVLDAAAVHQDQSSSPDALSASCRELAQVASAHAAQRAELENLMQRQHEASASAAAPPRTIASSFAGSACPQPLSGSRLVAAHKSRAHIKLNVRPKRPRSAVDTTAWPPGPQQAAGVHHAHPVETVKRAPQSSVRLLAHKPTAVRGKTVSSHLMQPPESMLAALEPDSLGTDNVALPPDACLTRLPGLVADAACSEQRLPSAAITAAQAPNQEQERPSAVGDRDMYGDHRAGALSQQPVSTAAPSTSGAEVAVLCLLDSQAPITEHTAASSPEPSFDTVHAMLSALHLPKLGRRQSEDLAHVEAMHIQNPVVWPVETAAAEGGQLARFSQSPAVHGQHDGLTIGGAFQLLGLGPDDTRLSETGSANARGRAPSRLAKIRAIKVVLQARRGQGQRELQQCYERMQDVQRQLAMQQVVVGSGGMSSRQPALVGVTGAMWLGGTAGQQDSKHKGMHKPVADGRFKPRHKGGDAWTGSEYKMRLLTGLATKLHAKLGLLALQHNCLNAQHCNRLLDQVEDRDMELLAQAGLQAFKSNAACFWVGQRKAIALKAMHAKADFRQKLQAWQHWAGKRCLLRDRLRLVLIACRRTTLVSGFAHWAVLVRSRKLRRAQRVMAGQWHLVRLHVNILCAWRSHAHKLQVMRSKLTPQTQPSPAVSSSSRADMLLRCRGMFAASLQQVHAATGELHNLQRVMRFHATREDVAWAALRAGSTVQTFRAVKAQLSSPAKHAVPDLGCLDICNASRSLVCHQVPLSLMHWCSLPKAEPFQELLGDIDHSFETDSTSTAILSQHKPAEEPQVITSHADPQHDLMGADASRQSQLDSIAAYSQLCELHQETGRSVQESDHPTAAASDIFEPASDTTYTVLATEGPVLCCDAEAGVAGKAQATPPTGCGVLAVTGPGVMLQPESPSAALTAVPVMAHLTAMPADQAAVPRRSGRSRFAAAGQDGAKAAVKAVERRSKTGSKVGKQLGSRKVDSPGSQAATDTSRLQHIMAAASVKHVEVPKERGVMHSDTFVRRETSPAASSSSTHVLPSQMHAASPRSDAVPTSMRHGGTLQAAAVSPKAAAVSPRAAAVSPKAAVTPPSTSFRIPRPAAVSPRPAAASSKAADPRPAAASPRSSLTARATSTRPPSVSPKAAAKSRPAFVSATRSGCIVLPSHPVPHQQHSGRTLASRLPSREAVKTQLVDHWPSKEHPAAAVQMDCQALVPQVETHPVPLIYISRDAFSAGRDGMAEPPQDQQSHSSAHHCPIYADCPQKASNISQAAANHLYAADSHRHMATDQCVMATGHRHMAVDHCRRATDRRHMAVHHCHKGADHRRSDASDQADGSDQQELGHPLLLASSRPVQASAPDDMAHDSQSDCESSSRSADSELDCGQSVTIQLESALWARKRQVSSARDDFAQQPDSVGSIAQLFMMRQRAKAVLQALAVNVDQRRLQQRHAQQRQVPAMLRRCLRIWAQSALDTKQWLLHVRSPVLLAESFASWCQYHKARAMRQQQLVYLQGRHCLVLMSPCFQAWRLRFRRQAFLVAAVQHCRHRHASHLLQQWQAWVQTNRSLRQHAGMVHRAHQGYIMRQAWRHWQWLASSKAILVRVFERCEHSWELYDPRCEEYEQLVACVHNWKDRARHKREKREQLQQKNCADAFRTMCVLLTGFHSFQYNHCQAVKLQCAMHSRDRLFAVWRRTVNSKVADWMHGPCLASTRRRLHLQGWVSEHQWHQQYQTRRLLSAGWTAFSRDITIPRRHRHHHLLLRAFTALHAATAARAAQLGLFWQRWQVHFPLQVAMTGWRAVRVATARERLKDAWGLRARRCLLQRRAFVAWKAVVAVQYSQACKLQAAKGHHREQMLRRHWSAWLYVVGQQKKAVRQHRRCLMQAGFTALLQNAAAVQHHRAGAAATQLEQGRRLHMQNHCQHCCHHTGHSSSAHRCSCAAPQPAPRGRQTAYGALSFLQSPCQAQMAREMHLPFEWSLMLRAFASWKVSIAYWRSQTAFATNNRQQVPVLGNNRTQDASGGSYNSVMLSNSPYLDNQENAHPWRQHPQSDRSNLMPDWCWLGPYGPMDAKVECHIKPQTIDCLNYLRKQRTAM